MSNQKLADKFNPKDFEDKLYNEWEKKGNFRPSGDKTKEPYCIMMPPPNVTGKLHMGHALDDTIQDVLIRYKRMRGYNTLWLPGTDHASISTEMKVVQLLYIRYCQYRIGILCSSDLRCNMTKPFSLLQVALKHIFPSAFSSVQ